MENNNTGLAVLFARPAATLFVLVAGITLAAAICFSIELIPFALGIACFLFLLAFSRLKTTNLLLAYIVADHLCQFLKRAIFLLGPQPKLVYWGFQLLPTLLLALAVVSSFYSMRKTIFPLSTKLLMLFIAICVAQTFLSPSGAALINRFAGANQSIVPLFAAFAGMAISPGEWRRFGKLFLVLVIISSIYGIFQWAHGPTAIDRAWALQTGDYSIEGSKVFLYITGARPDFRAYSYYADPTTWGFFLVLGSLFLVALRQREWIPSVWIRVAASFALLGIVVAETRSVWVALLGALLVHWVLGSRSLRHPVVVITGILVAFGLVLSAGQYALDNWAPRLTGNALLNRYMTVGTISARTSALKIFIRTLPKHIVMGDGYGTADNPLETFDERTAADSDYYSHNLIVGLLLSLGLPGLLTFGAFFYRWLWESLRTLNRSPAPIARSQLWIISACVGMLFTGSVVGPLFLDSSYFMIFVGIAMGETIRLRQRVETERLQAAMDLKTIYALATAAREVGV
jgi:hypothetical protein